MDGKIDDTGKLYIKRKSLLQVQWCPWNDESECGDWCVQFGEPIEDDVIREFTNIKICQNRTLLFGEGFEDERK